MADEVLQQGVRGITDLMVMPGLINLDFADVRSVMSEMGKAMMGTGEADGDNRAIEAAEKAISNPLLDGVSMKGAKGVIISITGGEDMRLMEVDEAASHIKELVDPDANIIWGSAFNNDLGGKIRVSVVATGIEAEAGAQPAPGKVFTFPARSARRRRACCIRRRSNRRRPMRPKRSTGADEERRAAARRRRHPDQPGRRAADRSAGRTRTKPTQPTASGGGTLFERMSNIARGAPKAQIDEDEPDYQARADRHPALPQPPEQPVSARDRLNEGRSRWGCPFSLTCGNLRIRPPHRLQRTVHRKASRQKASGKILCRTGRTMRELLTDAAWRALAGVRRALRRAAAPAAAQGSYSPYAETPPRRLPATSARSPPTPRISRR